MPVKGSTGRTIGGVNRPVVKIISKERRVQTVNQKTFGTGVAVTGSEFRENLPKATNVTREDIINIFGGGAVTPKTKPPQNITIDLNQILNDLKGTTQTQRTPARTIARQKGLRTIGEIKQSRYGRRVDPFGNFKGKAKI